MYEVRVQDEFSAAHKLRGYKGKCERLHGHNWKVELAVSSKKIDKNGMVIDFRKLKNMLKDILKHLDHSYLNSLSYFKKVNPTSENIACFIYKKISSQLLSQKGYLCKVAVWESGSSYALYYEEQYL